MPAAPVPPLIVPLTPAPSDSTNVSAAVPPVRFSNELKLTEPTVPALLDEIVQLLVEFGPVSVSLTPNAPLLPTKLSMPVNPPAALPFISEAAEVARFTNTALVSSE